MDDDLMFRPALEQARLVREGEVTARELVEASLDAIERLNPEINAFVHLTAEQALAAADAVEPGDPRPFAGVPIAIKDLIALTAGVRTTFGMKATGDWAPSLDSHTYRRLRDAGAIMVGKTNTPEMGILPVTEPDRFGPTRNPWDTSRTCGGSSGGSAAAVAAGMTAIGYANDGGGSIRIPASCCGLYGLKPSRGRVSAGPEWTELVAGFAVEGVVTRTVADTAAALDVMSGPEAGDPYWAPPPSAPFADAVGRDPGTLRIVYTTEAPNGAPVHEHCVAAILEAVELLESLGHQVEERGYDWDGDAYVENFVRVWMGVSGDEIRDYERLLGHPIDRDLLEPLTQEMIALADTVTATDYLHSLGWLRRLSRQVVGLWDDIDVMLMPTLAQPPIPIGALAPGPDEPALQMLLNSAGWVPFTPVWNVTGQPAASIPLVQSPDGLPIGIQLIGPPAGEELLLSLSAQLESARPWADRRPELARA
ncbi:MAG: amidase [Thermoleophilales bacterium]|jgi:amidase|nr:amidase [Thermoleophilales bacterium]